MIQERLFESQATVFDGLHLFERDKQLMNRADELLHEWQRAYPQVDLHVEIPSAHAWQVAHPSRRKKCQIRFLANWLKRASKNSGETWNIPASSIADAIRNAM